MTHNTTLLEHNQTECENITCHHGNSPLRTSWNIPWALSHHSCEGSHQRKFYWICYHSWILSARSEKKKSPIKTSGLAKNKKQKTLLFVRVGTHDQLSFCLEHSDIKEEDAPSWGKGQRTQFYAPPLSFLSFPVSVVCLIPLPASSNGLLDKPKPCISRGALHLCAPSPQQQRVGESAAKV